MFIKKEKDIMDVYEEELRKGRYNEMLIYLSKYEDRGIPLFVNGKQFPKEVCAKILTYHESETFMEDLFYKDGSPNLLEMVNFDRVVSY